MKLQIPVKFNNKGFSLIEVLVAMLLLSLVLFVVAETAVIYMHTNLQNRVRDEAVNVTQNVLYNVRTQPFDAIADPDPNPVQVTRRIGNTDYVYSVAVNVNTPEPDFKTIQAICSWEYGIRKHARKTYTHTANSVVKR